MKKIYIYPQTDAVSYISDYPCMAIPGSNGGPLVGGNAPARIDGDRNKVRVF